MSTTNALSTALSRVSDDTQATAALATVARAPSRELRDQVAFFHLLAEIDTSDCNGNYQGFFYVRAVELANRRRCSLLELTLADMLEIRQVARDDFTALMNCTSEFTYDDLINFATWWEELTQ